MQPGEEKRLLRWYPEPWRRRYGDELVALVEDTLGAHSPGRRLRWSLAMHGLRERTRHNRVIGAAADREERIRGGAALVLWGWALLLPAGFSFAKLIEHWDAATPSSDRTVPSVAVGAAQAFAVVGAVAILVAAAVAATGLARSLRHGAWSRLRRSVAVAGGLAAANLRHTA
jgi:hypothetical protein